MKKYKSRKKLLFSSVIILSLTFSFLPLGDSFSVKADAGPNCFLYWSQPTLSDGRGVRRVGELSNVIFDFHGFSPNQTVVLKNTNLNNGDTRSVSITVDGYGNFYYFDRTPIRADEYGPGVYKTEILDTQHGVLATCDKSFVILPNTTTTTTTIPPTTTTTIPPTTTTTVPPTTTTTLVSTSKSINIILPRDNVETWERGKTYPIFWQSSGVNKIHIKFGLYGGAAFDVLLNSNPGVYDFTVPYYYPTGPAKVYVIDDNNSDIFSVRGIQISDYSFSTPAPPTPVPNYTSLDLKTFNVRNVSRGQSSFGQSVSAERGDELEFFINVSNFSSALARDVWLDVNLPSYLTFTSGSLIVKNSRLSNSRFNGVFLGNLYSGDQQDIFFRARSASYQNGTNQIYANLSGSNFNSASRNVTVFLDSNSNSAPGYSSFVSISKLGKNISKGDANWLKTVQAEPGDTIQFSIMLTSNGGATARNVYVRDFLDNLLQFVPGTVTNNGASSSDSLVNGGSGLYAGDIFSGDVRFIKFQARVALAGSFSKTNTIVANRAEVKGDNISTQNDDSSVNVFSRFANSNPTQGTAASSAPATSAVIQQLVYVNPGFIDVIKLGKNLTSGQKTATKQVAAVPGDELEFQIKITSTGSKKVNKVFVKDSLPEQIDYIFNSSRVEDGILDTDTDIVRQGVNITSLKPNESRTITYRARVLPADEFSDQDGKDFEIESSVTVVAENVLQNKDEVKILIKLEKSKNLLGGLLSSGGNWLLLILVAAVALVLLFMLREEKKKTRNGYVVQTVR